MSESSVDLLGQTISVGDRIAGAFRTGNTAEMRVGEVLSFSVRGGETVIDVKWTNSSFGSGGYPLQPIFGSIYARKGRFIKLGA